MIEFNRRRWFEGQGQRSPTLLDVLPRTVEVRRGFAQPVYGEALETLFPDVSIVPFEETVTPEDEALFSVRPGQVQETPGEFFGRLFDAICDHIEARWLPRKVHVLFHSSGWDSRILGAALYRVVQRNGPAWAGDVVLFSFGPEAAMARRIMRHEGWQDDQIVTVSDPALWLWPVLDIGAGRWLNGAHPTVPVSRAMLIDVCREVMCLPENRAKLQTVSGYGSSSLIGSGAEMSADDLQLAAGFGSDYWLLGAGHNRLRRWAQRHYHSATAVPPAPPNEILPWLAHSAIRVALESTVRQGFELRQKMVAWLNPDLARFPRLAEPWPDFPAEVYGRMRSQYRASWYGKTCAPAAVPVNRALWSSGHGTLEKNEWWSHWTAACYCEMLQKEGYKLL